MTYSKAWRHAGRPMSCEKCGIVTLRMNPRQRYCPPCSAEENLKRQGEIRPKRAAATEARALRSIATGIKTSELHAENIAFDFSRPIDAAWIQRIVFPFTYSSSKNAAFSLAQGQSHLFLRQKAKNFRNQLALVVRSALRDRKIYQNKIWLEIFVQKPNHKGDGVNVVDSVCDALKEAIGIDDRWFSIKRLDWQICKKDPQLIIGILQERADCFDAQSCHRCGRILPLASFTKSRGNKNGVSRECLDCRNGRVIAPDNSDGWTERKNLKQRQVA